MPCYATLGLASAARAGLHITLWTYSSQVANVPTTQVQGRVGIVVKSANEILDIKVAAYWVQRGLGLQHLSDYIRLKAIKDGRQAYASPTTLACMYVRTYVHTYVGR